MNETLLDAAQYRELLDASLPVVIRTGAEHRRLLQTAAALMERPENEISPEEGRLLELLSVLIEEYENRAHPLPRTKPHKMLAYLLREKKMGSERESEGRPIQAAFLKTTNSVLVAAMRWALSRR